MANVLVQESSLQDIANAIRSKNGTQNTYKPAQMADAIEAISGGGGITPTGTIQITANGTHDVTNYASANVNVPTGTTPTGTKQISITQNGTTTEDVTNYTNAEITVNVQTSGGNELPSTFQEVEYIGVSNDCYFAIGERTYADVGFYADIEIESRNEGYGPHVISSVGNFVGFAPRSSTSKTRALYNGGEVLATGVASLGTRTVCGLNWGDAKDFFWMTSGTVAICANATKGSASTGGMYLCAYASNPTETNYHLVGKVYRIKLGNNGNVEEDFIPCYRKSDGVIGLYDVVKSVFYPNSGSGTLTKGSDIS